MLSIYKVFVFAGQKNKFGSGLWSSTSRQWGNICQGWCSCNYFIYGVFDLVVFLLILVIVNVDAWSEEWIAHV